MASSARLSSRQSPVVQRFRRAAQGRADTVLLDGDHLVREALDADVPLEVVLASDDHGLLADDARRAGATVWLATRAVLDAASPVRTPSGIVALARWQPTAAEPLLSDRAALVVGLVDVQDPGNVGAAIRSADALGASGLVALGDTANPGGWKALRGSMGSAFRLPIARGDTETVITQAQRLDVRVVVMVLGDAVAMDSADLSAPALVLVGNEGAGLPADVVGRADVRCAIRMRPGVDSLNVAVATALVVDEARRQRTRRPS